MKNYHKKMKICERKTGITNFSAKYLVINKLMTCLIVQSRKSSLNSVKNALEIIKMKGRITQ